MTSKPKGLSGFPEWLPEQQLVFECFVRLIEDQFRLYGFTPLETRSVEPLEVLLAKGATDKELYTVSRLADGSDAKAPDLGLHFDLTVPFARYVVQNRGHLTFPFRRYQIQKSWRGERPQEGRYREFHQADADVVADGELPLCHDSEMVVLLAETLTKLPIFPVTLHVSNRNVLLGFYTALGIADPAAVLRVVDKFDKIGRERVGALLGELGLDQKQIERCLFLAEVRGRSPDVLGSIEAAVPKCELLERGLAECRQLLRDIEGVAEDAVVLNFRIARGLDYYTGIIFEGLMHGFETFGAVCSGGRYDRLAAEFGADLPGVGISIGLTRLLGLLFGKGALAASRKTPTTVLVALDSAAVYPEAFRTAQRLRARGIASEVFDAPLKYSKQIRYAEQKGIPFVWFLKGQSSGGHEVRDIRNGVQEPASPEAWEPPRADRDVTVSRTGG
jgi:histidyl-tRNA synthetase